MSVIFTVVAAFAAIVAISRWQTKSATALGKVGAVMSTTIAFAEAWSKAQEIASKHLASPTAFTVPRGSANYTPPSSDLVVTRPAVRRREEDDFFDENPSFAPTGGIRGFDAYRRP